MGRLWDHIYDVANVAPTVKGWLDFLPSWLVFIVAGVVGILGVLAFLVPSQLLTIWVERRLVGRFQVRRGPNRVGPYGLLQPVADALKVMAKEALTPAGGDKWVFWLAPVVGFVPALLVYAVLPFGPGAIYADLNIGVLYVVAVSSVGVVNVFMAGWASNNKYSLLGAMRSVAQMVSYEIPMVLSLLGVVLLVGSMSTGDIVEHQLHRSAWFVLLQPLGFLVFFIAIIAELNRTPIDIMEAESEIVAGYHTEYSGMKFSLFYVAEYTNALAAAALLATLFFGGWGSAPLVHRVIPPWVIFIGKIYFFFCVLVWLRGTLPRLRVDQLMDFAWKFLLPLALVNIFITAAEVLILTEAQPVRWGSMEPVALYAAERWYAVVPLAAVNIVLCAVLIVGWTKLLRSGGISNVPSRVVPAADAVPAGGSR